MCPIKYSLGLILISELIVADLVMHSLSGMILLDHANFTTKVLLHESVINNTIQLIHLTICIGYGDLKMKGKYVG